MTAPVRHTAHEIKHAAQMAADLGLTVRLEKDGAITFMPVNSGNIGDEYKSDVVNNERGYL